MQAGAHLVVVVVLAAALIASCGGGDDASPRPSGAPAPSPAPAPRPPIVGVDEVASPPRPSRFIRTVDARCRQINRTGAAAAAARSLADHAAAARRERIVLQRLLSAVRRVRVPRGDRETMRRYRRALADQVLLDRRIERAARSRDAQAVAVGLRHNAFNRARRTQLARSIGLSSCLYGRRR